MSSDLVQKLRLAAAVILSTDGDRDWSNQSNLLVEEALAAANELKQSADRIEALEGEKQGWVEAEAQYLADVAVLVARAERLRVALVQFNNHFGPLADNEMLHPEARKCFHLARKALEGDKQ